MKTPFISIIVPIYKVEDFLLDCVKSITSQTYKHIEIILVDDGSPDKCPEICDSLATEDARIRVIHKANGGLSDARNVGINAAQGEYLLFIDSDDFWISNLCIDNLVKCLNDNSECEVIFFGRTTFVGDNRYVSLPPKPMVINSINKTQALTSLLRESDFISSACQKLIKRTLITDNEIFFQKGILSEDIDWSIRLYRAAQKFASVYSPYYGYRKRAGSISQSFNPKHATDILNILSKWDKILDENEDHEPFWGYLAYVYCCTLGLIGLLNPDDGHKFYDEYIKYVKLLDYDANPKVKKVNILYKLLGYRFTCKLLTLFLKFRPKRIK